jgi:hypothetical protein
MDAVARVLYSQSSESALSACSAAYSAIAASSAAFSCVLLERKKRGQKRGLTEACLCVCVCVPEASEALRRGRGVPRHVGRPLRNVAALRPDGAALLLPIVNKRVIVITAGGSVLLLLLLLRLRRAALRRAPHALAVQHELAAARQLRRKRRFQLIAAEEITNTNTNTKHTRKLCQRKESRLHDARSAAGVARHHARTRLSGGSAPASA